MAEKIEILFYVWFKYSKPDNIETMAIVRMTDDSEYDREFGTPRPRPHPYPQGGSGEDAADADAAAHQEALLLLLQEEARKSVADFRIKFTQAANASAAAIKRRRSPNSRTFYNIAVSRHVKCALDNLEKENDKIPDESRRIPKADIELLKRAIQNFRLKLIVHDSQTRDELKEQFAKARQSETEAEEAAHKAMTSSITDVDGYLNAKDRHQDAKLWRMDISNELTRTEQKFNRQTGALDAPGVPSQHAQIPEAAGVLLRNILSPETIRRRFISLETLTRQIRNDVAAFLSDPIRHKDRNEVIQQIKESKKK